MFQVDAHPDVYQELEYSRKWYEDRAVGLGNVFLNEVNLAVDTIRKMTLVWAFYDRRYSVRRYIVHRFPYGLIYTVQGDLIKIYAVMHLKRHPDYWRTRLRNW